MRAKPRRYRRRREGGFSLIEIMVAMTFLAIGLLAIAQLIPFGMKGVTDARVRSNAVQTGQRILDGLRAADYDSLDAGTYTETSGRYASSWTITDNSPVSGMKRVDLTTTWGPNRNPRTVVLSTYLTRNH
jgi:type IV pilus modification protein PilV